MASAVFIVREHHVRENALHALVGIVGVDELIKGVGGGDVLAALDPADHRKARDRRVEDEERQDDPRQNFAHAVRNFQNPFGADGIELFDPEDAQQSPEERIQQTNAAVDVEGQVAVIPRAGAPEQFLHPGESIFHRAAHDHAAQHRQPAAAVAELVKHDAQRRRARTVERVERAVDQAVAALEITLVDEAPEQLDDDARKAADVEHPKELVDIEPLGKVVALVLLLVDQRIGGGGGDQAALALAAGGLGVLPARTQLIADFIGFQIRLYRKPSPDGD